MDKFAKNIRRMLIINIFFIKRKWSHVVRYGNNTVRATVLRGNVNGAMLLSKTLRYITAKQVMKIK